MKRRLIVTVTAFLAFLLLPFIAYAGHEFLIVMREASTLLKEESCGNGTVKIEYRLGGITGAQVLQTFVILEPNATLKNSRFYTENNKYFYSLILFGMANLRDEKQTLHLMKTAESGDLKELTASQWLQEIAAADLNAAKSLENKRDSDCVITFQPF